MLPSSITAELAVLPAALRAKAEPLLRQWHAAVAGDGGCRLAPAVEASMAKVWALSPFVAESVARHPGLLEELSGSGDLCRRYQDGDHRRRLAALAFDDEAGLMARLRQARRREMVRIAWRDLAGWAGLEETLLDLSNLADACIQAALDFLYQEACARRGTPVLADGRPQQMVVLGMGKLGGQELNFSSDIDLIFAYPEDGVLADRKGTSYGEFFGKLCQSLVRALDAVTVDGFVFRTDIRLRPFGDSGALVMTFAGMEHYYLSHAREWERYAMIKARPVAGDLDAAAELMAMLNAFVYRRYLDYGAFEALRGLKAQISQELRRKDRRENIKLGEGGIREIEFIGQAFQLIRGGRVKALQARGILTVLATLGDMGLIGNDDARRLAAHYGFLRRVENRLQQYQDMQTHDLPADALARQSLAHAMGFADWAGFKTALDEVRQQVHAIFDQVFALSRQAQAAPEALLLVEELAAGGPALARHLRELGFADPEAAVAAIGQFRQLAAIRRLSANSAAVLERLLQAVLLALKDTGNPDLTLGRVLALFAAVAGRAVYFSLLAENPHALAQLLRLASASPWLAEHLARHPVLFDELLDPRSLLAPLQRHELDAELARLLAPVRDDLEQLMVALRQFKQQQLLKVAAADLMGAIPVRVVSDHLTQVAESIVAQAVDGAWLMLAQKHGQPPGCDASGMGFAVLGFGKLGGIELGYGSDLDLVFICDYPDGMALTAGPRPIPTSQFYGRLGQRVRHILDTKLLAGVAYAVDMRLRPNGDSGLLVAHVGMYGQYLREQAWTWELQALVRGRFIAGDRRLRAAFEGLRVAMLRLPRESGPLRAEVRAMREKMRAALADGAPGRFDLKHGPGGMVDIEFMVQFWVLAHAANHPGLTAYTDNIRLLHSLGQMGLLAAATADTLVEAYCQYRDLGHKQALQGLSPVVGLDQVPAVQAEVARLWRRHMVDET